VALEPEEAWKVLRLLDDPDGTERPMTLDLFTLQRRFDALVAALYRILLMRLRGGRGFPFGPGCDLLRHRSNSSACDSLRCCIVARVSNFGTIAVFDLEGFGVYDKAERATLFDGADIARVEAVLDATGHVSMPVDILWTTYDGVNGSWQRSFPSEPPPSWFVRFFDWV
jgi:hypothetical protein